MAQQACMSSDVLCMSAMDCADNILYSGNSGFIGTSKMWLLSPSVLVSL